MTTEHEAQVGTEPEAAPTLGDDIVADAPEATVTAPDWSNLIGADGKFTDGWIDALPETLRTEASLRGFKDIQGLAKSFVSTKQMVGRDKIAVPTDMSSEAEWDAYYRAGGRPETPDDYQIGRPEDLPEEYYDEAIAKEAAQLFYQLGLSAKQANAILAYHNQQFVSGLKETQEAEAQARQEAKETLQRDWGDAYPQKIHLGNVAVDQATAGDEQFKQKLLEEYGDEPLFIRFAASLGGKFAEHGVVSPKDAAIPTPADLQSELNELRSHPAYMNTSHPQHKNIVDKVFRMQQKLSSSRRP